jgi:hypothetical protein
MQKIKKRLIKDEVFLRIGERKRWLLLHGSNPTVTKVKKA